jgi:predicted RNA-binding protein (TIGR00451 family)
MSLDYIFGKNTSKAIDYSKIEFQYSRKTGRLRYVVEKPTKAILFTFRPNGSIAPTVRGASILLSRSSAKQLQSAKKLRFRPWWTITVINGVTEFVSRGKTVFCKHVAHCDDSLRAGNDVAVLNEDGKLLAVGKAIMAGSVMKQFKRGAAVKVREGIEL